MATENLLAPPPTLARPTGRWLFAGGWALLVLGLVGYGPYNMAKEAVRALTRTAAREWAEDKITVNNLLPLAETWGEDVDVPPPTNALGRFGTPEEDIAPVVLVLASKDAQFLTGYTLTPDGGLIIDSAR